MGGCCIQSPIFWVTGVQTGGSRGDQASAGMGCGWRVTLSVVPRLRPVRNSAGVSSLLFLRAEKLTLSLEDKFSYVVFPWSFQGFTQLISVPGEMRGVCSGVLPHCGGGLWCFLNNSTRVLTISLPGVQ